MAEGDQAVRSAYGLTNEQGQYSLMTPIQGLDAKRSQGAVPGHYRVIISRLSMQDGSAVPTGLTDAEALEQGAQEQLPPRYSSDLQSVLSADIVREATHDQVNFELK